MMRRDHTPVIEISDTSCKAAGVRLLVKREDLNHPAISGNKWWKLKYNVEQARADGHHTLLTFGGAFSNHIYATAAAARENGLRSIGVIRGEKHSTLNPTLSFAQSQGMQLYHVSREDYRQKDDTAFIAGLRQRFGSFYLIPEGGTNELAIKGCDTFAREELASLEFDHLMLPVGTGGTIAGIICGLEGSKSIIGVPVLKNGEFLSSEISRHVMDYSGKTYGNWSLLTSYHHGGYAKVTTELLGFVSAMKKKHNLPLDHVYTGKLLFAVMREITLGKFPAGSTILVIHTGGLQGSMHAGIDDDQ